MVLEEKQREKQKLLSGQCPPNSPLGKEVLGICFDFGHANVGNLNMYKEIVKIGSKLIITHIHDNYGTDSHNQPFQKSVYTIRK